MSAKKSLGKLSYDGESDDFESFQNQFEYDSLMFSWSETDQVKAIKFCIVGKAKRYYNELRDDDKKDINKIMKKLKESLAKAPEFYLNLFSTRQLKPGESISSFCHSVQSLLDRMPGLKKTSRDRLLGSRLIAIAPENLKNFLEILNDRSWDYNVGRYYLDKSAYYKSINQVEIEPRLRLQNVG